jgi:hypothetical protein
MARKREPGTPHRRWSPTEIHWLLIARSLSPEYRIRSAGYIATQALHCPYYVPLDGHLGSDWGVIVSPLSSRFGLLTFEHDHCGCRPDAHPDGGTQTTDEWSSTNGETADSPGQER